VERTCFIFWSKTEGESESEQRSEKPSDASIRNLGRGSIVGGSDERNGQKRCFAKLAADFLLEFPVVCCDGVVRTVDAGDSSSRRWRISGSAVIYGGVLFLTKNSSHGDVL
jgi:hypothetical protein